MINQMENNELKEWIGRLNSESSDEREMAKSVVITLCEPVLKEWCSAIRKYGEYDISDWGYYSTDEGMVSDVLLKVDRSELVFTWRDGLLMDDCTVVDYIRVNVDEFLRDDFVFNMESRAWKRAVESAERTLERYRGKVRDTENLLEKLKADKPKPNKPDGTIKVLVDMMKYYEVYGGGCNERSMDGDMFHDYHPMELTPEKVKELLDNCVDVIVPDEDK